MKSFNKLPIKTQGAILLVAAWVLMFTVFGVIITSAVASNELEQCIQTCTDKYPVVADKVFPDNLTFEDVTDQGIGDYHGTAAVLFPAKWENKIVTVTMNGEKAQHGNSYKGRPVFRFKKVGTQYNKPLKFIIETTSGIYSYSIGYYEPVPEGVYKNKATYTMYNVGDGGRNAWRIQPKGTDYGKSFMMVFESGYTETIKDSSKRYANSKGLIYRPGTGKPVKPIKTQEETSHGGVYLYAPYGDKSKKVTFQW